MTSRVVPMCLAGLVALRLLVVGHAPATADAFLTAALALALALVVRGTRARRALPLTALTLVTLAVVVGVLVSPHPMVALLSAPLLIGAGLAFALGRVVDDEARRALDLAVVAGALIHAAAALVQRFITWPDALARADELELETSTRVVMAALRPLGLSLSPDLMSGIVLVGLALALTLASAGGRARLTLLALPLLVAALLVARSTTSLAAFGALAVIVVGVARGLRAMLGAVLAGALAFHFGSRGVLALLTSLDERLANWRVALTVIADAPVAGGGLGTYAARYAALRPPEANETLYAHSAPLHVWSELGVVGLVLVLGAAVLIVHAWRAGPRSLGHAARAAAPTALFLRSLVDYDLQVGQSLTLFALTLGLALPRVIDDDERPLTRYAPPRAALAVIALFVAGVGVRLEERAALLAALATPDAALDSELDAYEGGSDPLVDALVARAVVERAARCHPTCPDARARAHARVDALLADPAPIAEAFVVGAQLAIIERDLALARARLAQALTVDRSCRTAHALRVDLALATGDDAALADARRDALTWLPASARALVDERVAAFRAGGAPPP